MQKCKRTHGHLHVRRVWMQNTLIGRANICFAFFSKVSCCHQKFEMEKCGATQLVKINHFSVRSILICQNVQS